MGVHIDRIEFYGSMELAPLVGLPDIAFDLFSSGGTRKANSLIAVEDISDNSSRLVMDQASLKLEHGLIQPVIDAFAPAVAARDAA